MSQAVSNQLRQFPQFNPMLPASGQQPDIISQAIASLQQRLQQAAQSPYGQVAAMALPMALEAGEGGMEEPPPEAPPPTRPTTPLQAVPTMPLHPEARTFQFDPGRYAETTPLTAKTAPFKWKGTEPLPEVLNRTGTYETSPHYHGSPNVVPELLDPRRIDQGEGLLYGRGLYTTNDYYVAHGYAKERMAGSVRPKPGGSIGPVYKVYEINPVKFIDAGEPVPMNILRKLRKSSRLSPRDRTELAYLLEGNDQPQIGELLGPDSPFKSGWEQRGNVYQIIPSQGKDALIDLLQERGYGGLSHIGGQMLGGPEHNVKIYWNKNDIRMRALNPSVSSETPMHVAAPMVR